MTKEKRDKKPIYKRWWFWLIIIIIGVGALGSDDVDKKEESTELSLLNDVYSVMAKEKKWTTYDNALKFIKEKNFKYEEDKDLESIKVIDDYSDDYVYISKLGSPQPEKGLLTSISFYSSEKDIEIGIYNNIDGLGNKSDYLQTHIIGEPAKNINSVDEQLNFLKNTVNPRKQAVDDNKLDQPIDLTFKVNEVIDESKIYFTIKSNFPDGLEGIVTLSKEDFNAQDKFTIKNGEAKTNIFSNKGNPLSPGEYNVSITTPISTVLNNDVLAKVGKDYSNYSSQYLEGEDGSIHFSYNYQVTIK